MGPVIMNHEVNYYERIHRFKGRESNYYSNLYIQIQQNPFFSEDITEVTNYLKDPPSVGLWILEVKNNLYSGICEHISKELDEKLILGSFLPFNDNKLYISTQEMKEQLIEDTFRLSFINGLFLYITLKEEKSPKLKDYEEFIGQDKSEIFLFNTIDLDNIAKIFSEAFTFFKSNLYSEKFFPSVADNKMINIQGKFLFIYESINKRRSIRNMPSNTLIHSGPLKFISLNHKPLEDYNTFLKKLGRVYDDRVYRVFSPEDELLSPYYIFFKYAQKILIKNTKINGKIDDFINEYEQHNYSHSISGIGIIFEEYLTEIYETCFRERCPKQKTIGELYDLIERKNNILFGKRPNKPESDTLFAKINEKLNDTTLDHIDNAEVLELFREILEYIKQNNSYLSTKIELLDAKHYSNSIFPSNIREDIIDLLRYRNATSHKTRDFIGDYETLKSIYCFASVILWWINEKECIDWKMQKEEILKQLISKSVKFSN